MTNFNNQEQSASIKAACASGYWVPPDVAVSFALAKAEMPEPKKTKEARVKTKSGYEYTYTYAGLDDLNACINPVLAKHGMAYTQQKCQIDKEGYELLITSVVFPSGFVWVKDSRMVRLVIDPKDAGAEETYKRRYALMSVFGLSGTDDLDAQEYSEETKTPREMLVDACREYAQVSGEDAKEVMGRYSAFLNGERTDDAYMIAYNAVMNDIGALKHG